MMRTMNPTPLLEFRHVSCKIPDAEPVVDLTFSLDHGSNAVFFGVEGSGLRSLSQLILGLETRYEGDILFQGDTIRGLDYLGRLSYLNRIGYIHGDYGLISNMTVEQNISLRLEYYSQLSPQEIREVTERLMAELGIISRRSARPVELRLSEILRTAYARAVAHNPDLLIMEHALIGHSPLNIRSFMDVLERRAAASDMSVIFITYEPQKFLDLADSFYMVYKGRMVFTGGREEFLNSDNRYVAQYRESSLDGPMKIE